jgi:MoaA/NifB/PqqE/SkfB family radical SAM enzyme
MDWQTFERLSRSLGLPDMVYMSGWGEPLVHPRFWDMVAVVKKRGHKVGFTTNGTLIDESARAKLIELVDVIGVSLDGASASIYQKIRPGSQFNQVIENIRRLVGEKRRAKRATPEVALLFIKMKPNMHELTGLVELAAELGVDRVVATNLDYLAKWADDSIKAFGDSRVLDEYEEIVRQAKEVAERLRIPFKDYPITARHDLVSCEALPLETVYVSWQGNLSPCVYLSLPMSGQCRRIFEGKQYDCSNFVIGNINYADFGDLLQESNYQRFLTYFMARRKAFQQRGILHAYSPSYFFLQSDKRDDIRPASFTDMDWIANNVKDTSEIMDAELIKEIARISEEFPFPPECQTCYKRFGL